MKKKDEVSPGGTIAVHHESGERGSTQAAPPPAPDEIEAHFSAHFGEPESVIHKVMSDTVHMDVHVIPPRPEREWWTLFTTGMSVEVAKLRITKVRTGIAKIGTNRSPHDPFSTESRAPRPSLARPSRMPCP